MAKNYFSGLLTGVIFGAVGALLLAPKRGEELRGDLKDRAEKAKDRASTVSTAVGVAAIDLKDHGTELVSSALEKGAEIKSEAASHLSEVKETLTNTASEVKSEVAGAVDDASQILDENGQEVKDSPEQV